jgi:uncharacterized small protein (DUF1192 family)
MTDVPDIITSDLHDVGACHAKILELHAEIDRLKRESIQFSLDVMRESAGINDSISQIKGDTGKLINRVRKLTAENERLKASLHPSDAEPGDTIVKTYPNGSMLVDSKAGTRRRVKHLGTVEMLDRVRELERHDAQVSADVQALRRFVVGEKWRFVDGEIDPNTSLEMKCALTGARQFAESICRKLNELKSFREGA